MLGMLIAAMEGTVVSTAMPTVIGDLHGIRVYSWVFSLYLLTSTTTVPIYGKLADLYGRRRVFLTATSIFLIGSMLSGAARTMPQLIAARGLQGLGAGGVLPITLTIVGDMYTLRERGRVQALFTSVWGLSSLAGPLVGAALTQALSWRWVFYVNLPFGLVSAALVGAFLRESRAAQSGARLDLPGLALMTGGVVALLIMLLQLGTLGGRLPITVVPGAVVAAGCLGAFVWQERRAADPMLPLSLFTNPVIAASTIGNVLIGLLIYGVDTYVPLFMQGVRGGGPRSAGLALTPMLLSWSLSAYAAGRMLHRAGFVKLAAFGTVTILAATISLAAASAATPTGWIEATMAVMGVGLGYSSMTFLVFTQNAVAWDQRGVVTAATQFFRSMSGTIGVAALGAVLGARMAAMRTSGGQAITAEALVRPEAHGHLSSAALRVPHAALAGGLHTIFVLIAAAAAASAALILRILLCSPAAADNLQPQGELQLDVEPA